MRLRYRIGHALVGAAVVVVGVGVWAAVELVRLANRVDPR